MFLNFFQGFSPGFRQKRRDRDEVNHGGAGECNEHRRIAIFADGRKKIGVDGRREGLVDEQRNARNG